MSDSAQDRALNNLQAVLNGIVRALDEDRRRLEMIRRGEASLLITRKGVHLMVGALSPESAGELLVDEIEDFLGDEAP